MSSEIRYPSGAAMNKRNPGPQKSTRASTRPYSPQLTLDTSVPAISQPNSLTGSTALESADSKWTPCSCNSCSAPFKLGLSPNTTPRYRSNRPLTPIKISPLSPTGYTVIQNSSEEHPQDQTPTPQPLTARTAAFVHALHQTTRLLSTILSTYLRHANSPTLHTIPLTPAPRSPPAAAPPLTRTRKLLALLSLSLVLLGICIPTAVYVQRAHFQQTPVR